MPASSYTTDEASIHELGHAAIALALELSVDRVTIRRFIPPGMGWAGQCHLVGDPNGLPAFSFVRECAFQLGGPLIQVVSYPQTLGLYLTDFEPSIFKRAGDSGAVLTDLLNKVGWGTDLGMPAQPMMLMVPHAQPLAWLDGFRRNTGWLMELEKHCRVFLSDASVRSFVSSEMARLAADKTVSGPVLKASFLQSVDKTAIRNLVHFCEYAEAIPTV